MHRPVFLLGPCMLKWSLLSLCCGIISSGLCFYFYRLWIIFFKTENPWLSCSYSLAKYKRWTFSLLDIYTIAYPIISSIFLRIFGDMISSIECECAVFIPRSDKEDIYSSRIWFCLLMSSRTCLKTANKLLLSAATWWKYSAGYKVSNNLLAVLRQVLEDINNQNHVLLILLE